MKKLNFCVAAGISLIFSFAPVAMADESVDTDSDVFLITNGDPNDPKFANAGDNLRTGVGSIFIVFAESGGFICSMSVIDDRHILTAAHCLRSAKSDGSPDTVALLAVVLPASSAPIYWSDEITIEFAVHPFYDFFVGSFGAFAPGDIAVIKLPFDLPADVERYDLYRSADEFGQVTRHYGHGVAGTGDTGGSIPPSFFYARTGLNTYDATLQPFFGPLFDSLLYDYDNQRAKNNAVSWWFGGFLCNSPNAAREMCATQQNPFISDHTDYNGFEVGLAGGDSGGPGFIDGKVAGVHSFGFTHFCDGTLANKPDFTCGLDNSWGEMNGDTRVSSYADWVDAVIAELEPTTPIPEPAPAAASGGDGLSSDFELSAQMQYFLDAAIFRSMRREATLEEFKAEHGVD